LLLVSFFDIYAGIAGLLAVIISNAFAVMIGLDKNKVREGAYGFNSLLVGLGIGIYYQPGIEFYIILFFISLLTLFFTVGLEGVLGKYGLPYLSIPFLFGIWMVIIASKGYSALTISERGIYNLNDMYAIGGMTMVRLYEWFNNLAVPESLRIYFKSLSAILFQYHMFAGILIAIGLLFYSRLAFLFSLIGFYAAFYFYRLIGADISELLYSYIGFNYILTAIAVGGFFVVPSRQSVLWILLLTPLVAMILSSTTYLFSFFGLSVFSLPFNIVVILFIYVLKFRLRNHDRPALVSVQQYSPEQHAYNYHSYLKRFGSLPVVAMKLPFWGEWKVTQAHNGEHTHKDEWRHAWDFEIADEQDRFFDGNDSNLQDYYCFGKPVNAPASGIVEEIEDGIEDNDIGDMNLDKNWGNSVVIKHEDGLYSQISHLKKFSIKVKPGQEVKDGEVIGMCGNSGRSPVPHIHMQFQKTPSIGSKTIDYPISSFISREKGSFAFKTTAKPELSQTVSNPDTNKLLKNAYHFVPGQTITFNVEDGSKTTQVKWKVNSDIYNNVFIECESTGSTAWFKILGDTFYFTYFKGNKNSLLFYFYLSSFKVVHAFYPNMTLQDDYPLNIYPGKIQLIIQDFCLPFYRFLTAKYEMVYESFNSKNTKSIRLNSTARFGKNSTSNFTIRIGEKGIGEIEVKTKLKSINAVRKF
jgi:urea transporter/murein DD-endopeptidase MepM/ murein hydrolase activator NlpD